ncbi:MAG TPA: SRPBCC domain-containing protein [Solirubrobacteraceae bacterium]|jgi:uncharacterized protein YndB with AHSA1/START domain|nr:SRPBCC domain-containing protein [Solirubrobacteraceae bacterium]
MTDDPGRVEIVRTLDAPREAVFRAWTDPTELRRWWGPGEFRCPEAEVDLRPSGAYRLVMQPTEGEPFVLGGTFREVKPPERLVYTWRWETGPAADGSESLVEVEFHDRGDRTELRLVHTEFPESHGAAPYRMGWESGLDKLAALLQPSAVDA